MRRNPSVERRVIGLVGEARLALHDYGVRPLTDGEISRLMAVYNLTCAVGDMEGLPALLFPPIAGKYRIVMDAGLPLPVRRYIKLHELGHVLAGEADEPVRMLFDGALPESEDVCDLFALLGLLDEAHIGEGGDWLEQKIRELVPLEDRGWQVHRIPRLAKKLPRVREMVRNLHGYF